MDYPVGGGVQGGRALARILRCILVFAVAAAIASPVTGAAGETEANLRARVAAGAWGASVAFEGVVTFVEAEQTRLFVQDEVGGVLVRASADSAAPPPGARVAVRGLLTEAEFRPAVREARLVVLDTAESWPPTVPRLPEQLSAQQDDGRWVEVEASVRSIVAESGRHRLFLEHNQRWVEAFVPDLSAEDADRMVNARVRVRGVCRATLVPTRGDVRFALEVPARAHFRVDEWAPPSPYHSAVQRVADLRGASRTGAEAAPVHVIASVERELGGECYAISDASGQIELVTSAAKRLKRGQIVEVLGELRTEAGASRLVARALRLSGVTSDRYMQSPEAARAAPITSVARIRALTREEAAAGYPIRLRAVVSYFDTEWGSLFVQDDTAGIFVNPNVCVLDVAEGDDILIEGQTDPGAFGPMIVNPRVQVLGRRPRPVGESKQLRDLDGSMDSQRLRLTCIIRAVTDEGGHHFTLDAVQGTDHFALELGNFDRSIAPPEHLIGAHVEVQGICSAVANPQRQYLGSRILVSRLGDIVIRDDARPEDAFALPISATNSLLQFVTAAEPNRLVRVRGTVTYHQPGEILYLQDTSGGLLVRPAKKLEVSVGDVVDAVGFAETEGFLPAVVQARCRRTTRQFVQPPVVLGSAAEALNVFDVSKPTHAGELVRLRGRLIDRSSNLQEKVLLLQDGTTTYTALMIDASGEDFWSGLSIGSLLEVTGVCAPQVGTKQTVATLRVLLPSRNSIVVLARPPWWTMRYTMAVIALLLLAAALSAGWVRVLRRQVAAQTKLIEERLERERNLEVRYRELFANNPHPMWVHDADTGEILAVNEAATAHYGYTREEFTAMQPADLLAIPARSQAAGVAAERVESASEGARRCQHRRKDGAVIDVELSEKELSFGGRKSCIVLVHDITRRLRAEAELARAHQQLVETSHLAGMAEVATSVLHNVGNSLNSVNVSANVALESIRGSRLNHLRKLCELLAEQPDLSRFFAADPRAARTVTYLETVTDQLEAEQRQLVGELETLQQHVDEVKQAVAVQQNYAEAPDAHEPLQLVELLDHALQLRSSTLAEARIQVGRTYGEGATVIGQRHRAAKLFLDVIDCARASCGGGPAETRRIHVSVEVEQGTAQIRVSDNGTGFGADGGQHLFEQVFGGGGCARGVLHEAALTARAFGGTIEASSPGEGRGQTLHVSLPCSR